MKRNINIISIILLVFLLSTASFAANHIDIPNDWSKQAIRYSIEKGYIDGVKEKIEFEKDLTRAELIAMINKVTENIQTTDISDYKDVNEADWYYEDISKAVASGLIRGYKEFIRPNDKATREEAFTIIARTLDFEARETNHNFRDHENISPWALESIYNLYTYGYINGYNNLIRPRDNITKQELLQVIYNIKTKPQVNIINSYLELENLIYQSLLNFEDEVLIQSNSLRYEDIYHIIYEEKLITKILLENPDINYGYNAIDIEVIDDIMKIKIYYTTAHFIYFDEVKLEKFRKPREQMEIEKEIVERKVKKIVEEIISEDMTSFEKEKAIHDWVVLNGNYDHDDRHPPYRRNNYTPYGILLEGLGVCESYAKSFYMLAKEAGLEVIYLTGYAGGEYHAWNMVKLDDGNWYHVDTTWNDLGEEEIRYDYFNLTDKELKKTHSIYKIREYPEANGTKYFRDNLDLEMDKK